MRIVCQQTILMKYHALFVILKKRQNLKLSSAANCRWHFKGYLIVSQTSTLFLLAVLITCANSLDPDQDR